MRIMGSGLACKPWSFAFATMRMLLGLLLACAPLAPGAASLGSMRIALDDVPGVDMLNFLTAVERAKQRGLDIKVEYLRSEEIAVQAVLLGQADLGMGTPYATIQKSSTPIRLIYQLNTLRFFPVVNSEFYKSWRDLDGADVYVHGHGSGTEAIMKQMAIRHGITYRSMHYLPGSGVRARAMLRGGIKASIVDSRRRKLLQEKGQGRFLFLPVPEIHASDEALYVDKRFLEKNRAAVGILLEELLKVWRQVNKDPDFMLEAWKQYGLLQSGLGDDPEDAIRRYYSEMVKEGAFPDDGGNVEAALADFEFYGFAGTLEGDTGKLRVEDYWEFGPLKEALEALRQPGESGGKARP